MNLLIISKFVCTQLPAFRSADCNLGRTFMTTEPALPASYQRGSLQYFARKLSCGICCERLGRGKTGALPAHFATSSEKGNDKRMQKVERVVSREEFLIFLLPRVGFSKRKLGRLGTNLDSFGTKVRPTEPAESMLKKIHPSVF